MNVSFGTSKSDSRMDNATKEYVGSKIAAGTKAALTATAHDLTVKGSTVTGDVMYLLRQRAMCALKRARIQALQQPRTNSVRQASAHPLRRRGSRTSASVQAKATATAKSPLLPTPLPSSLPGTISASPRVRRLSISPSGVAIAEAGISTNAGLSAGVTHTEYIYTLD